MGFYEIAVFQTTIWAVAYLAMPSADRPKTASAFLAFLVEFSPLAILLLLMGSALYREDQ